MQYFLSLFFLFGIFPLSAKHATTFPPEIDSLILLARQAWKGENPKPLIASGYYEKARKKLIASPPATFSPDALYLFYQEALSLIDQNAPLVRNKFERQAFLRTEFPFLENGLEVCRQLYVQTGNFHYFEKAFEIIEKSKSLTNHFQSADLEATFQLEAVPSNLLKEKAQLSSQILALTDSLFHYSLPSHQTRLQILRDELSNLNSKIQSDYPNYHKFSAWNKPESAQNLIASLQDKEAVLEYFFGKKEVFLMLLTSKKQSIIKIASLEKVNAEIEGFVNTLKEPGLYKEMIPAAYQVYQTFIEPAIPYLEQIEKINCIPDGLLGTIPLEAALKSMPQKLNYDFVNLDYLIHHYCIAYHNSASQFIRQRKSNPSASSPNIAAFAPQFDYEFHQKFKAFPAYLEDNHYVKETQDSLIFLTKNLDWLANELNATIYKKEQATISNFKQHLDADILHFGTHVIFDARHPMQSKILLAKEKNVKGKLTGGFLTLETIQTLQLKGRLAVLAGCESGRGKFRHASGTNSLAYGFDIAGIPATLYSLWKVNEKESAYLIQNFYQNLQKNLSKDEALHLAKLNYLKNAKDFKAAPKYWAAFVINGDMSNFQFSAGFNGWFWFIILGLIALVFVKFKR